MAVATYKVSMANNVPILTPNENQIVFVNGDFLIFQQNGTNLNIKVTVVGAGGLPEIAVAIVDPTKAKRVLLGPPRLDADGNILLTFEPAPGGQGGFPPGAP